jgi:uncharacterized protein
VTPVLLRTALIVVGAVFIVIGVAASRRVPIGYQTAGTPIYRTDAKVNQDTAEISKFIPTNYAWVVLDTPTYPSPQSTVGLDTLRMNDDLAAYLISRGDAVAIISFETLGTKPMNMLLHNGFPKFLGMPDTNALSANLWSFFFGSTAPGEANSFFAYSPAATNTCIRLLLRDHTYARLTRLRDDLDTFMRARVKTDPLLDKVKVRYIGGDAGLYLATDDVISHLNVVNLTLVLAAIFLCCAVTFRSLVAGAWFVLACVMANFGAFVYMNAHDIGLTADTIPIISLGIGLGIAYGIYTVARIRDEVMDGLVLNDAVITALRTTGAWVFATFVVMVGGMLPWVFSPLLFHNEMSVLLILLMSANMVAGLLILPAVIAWTRPRFITRYEQTVRAQPTVGAAATQATS